MGERMRQVAAASALAIGVSMLAACSAGQSVAGNCTVPEGAAPAATAAAASPEPLTATSDPTRGRIGSAAMRRLPPSSTVTLVTGDRVRLDVAPDGSQTVSPAVEDAEAGSGGFVRFAWGGDQFAVPYAAVPYLNSKLDPRLFDVTYLVRAGLDDARSSTLPVTIQPAGGGEVDELPAVRVKKGSGATSATVDKSRADELGRLLMKGWRASRTTGPSASAQPLPVARIGLRTSEGTPLPAALPHAPATATSGKAKHYRTLSLDFTGPDGKPATAIGWVQNLDDSRIGPFIVMSPAPGTTPAVGDPGPVRVSVPDGTYSIAFTILTPHSGTYLGADGALVVKPEVTIKSDQTITLDARPAKPYQMSLDPPLTGTLRVDTLTLLRTGADGGGCVGYPLAMDLVSVQGAGRTASTLSATPTPKVTKGTLGFDAITGIAQDPPTSPQSKPRYYLDFTHGGAIPSALTYTVPQSRLTTVRARMYDHVSGTGCSPPQAYRGLFPIVYTFGNAKSFGQVGNVQPGEHTDYWYSNAPDQVLWATTFLGSECRRLYDAFRHIRPGEQIDQEWTKAPLAPGQVGLTDVVFGQGDPAAGPRAVCPACRQGDIAMLRLDSYGDSDPTHFNGYPDADRSRVRSDLAFYRNGTLVTTSESVKDGWLQPHRLVLPLLPEDATYRLDWTYSRLSDPSATVRTDWTFRSRPDDPAAALPKTEVCTPDARSKCSFLPLLFIRYDLALNQKSQAKAGGPFEIAFTVAHQQNAPAPNGPVATVAVSFDDGKTWSDAVPATAVGGGKFTASITHPPLGDTGGLVSLRVRAHDDTGNAVEQTIIRAYGLTD